MPGTLMPGTWYQLVPGALIPGVDANNLVPSTWYQVLMRNSWLEKTKKQRVGSSLCWDRHSRTLRFDTMLAQIQIVATQITKTGWTYPKAASPFRSLDDNFCRAAQNACYINYGCGEIWRSCKNGRNWLVRCRRKAILGKIRKAWKPSAVNNLNM